MLCAALLLAAPAARALTLQDIADRLDAASPYHASARYEVLLPQYEEPVSYFVGLNSKTTAAADSLSPCDYLIDWTIRLPEGESDGFNAYAAGHHYRFRDKRLQEYHADADATPFAPGGRKDLGVQQQAQFVQLLPQYVARRLRDMAADSCYSYTLTPGRDSTTVVVQGAQSYRGVEAMTFRYVFSTADGLPVAAEFCYNPSQMSEQTVSVDYGTATTDASESFDEASLMALYPEAFGRYRESNYTLENLPGRPLPDFSATRLNGERYVHSRGESFGSPAVVAVLDPAEEASAVLLGALRDAVDASPVVATLVVAIAGNHADDVAALAGPARDDEVVLVGARSLARNCGVAATPAVIVVGRDGVVRNIHVGFNKELPSLVIQEIAIAN